MIASKPSTSYRISWSYSRHKAWQGCPRAFYYEYHSKSDPQGRTAQLLRSLSTPHLLVGQVVDWQINEALARLARDEDIPEGLAERGVQAFQRLVEKSPMVVEGIRRLQKPPQNAQPLHHHFYGYRLGQEVFDRCEQKIVRCLNNWRSSEVLERIQRVPSQNWKKPRQPSDFNAICYELHGNPVYVAIDFWFVQDGKIHILDWKTSKRSTNDTQDTKLQMASYALWAVRDRGFPLQSVRTQTVSLDQDVRWNPTPVEQADLDNIERQMEKQLDVETLKLSALKIKDMFPARPEPHQCFYCKYRCLCRVGNN